MCRSCRQKITEKKRHVRHEWLEKGSWLGVRNIALHKKRSVWCFSGLLVEEPPCRNISPNAQRKILMVHYLKNGLDFMDMNIHSSTSIRWNENVHLTERHSHSGFHAMHLWYCATPSSISPYLTAMANECDWMNRNRIIKHDPTRLNILLHLCFWILHYYFFIFYFSINRRMNGREWWSIVYTYESGWGNFWQHERF